MTDLYPHPPFTAPSGTGKVAPEHKWHTRLIQPFHEIMGDVVGKAEDLGDKALLADEAVGRWRRVADITWKRWKMQTWTRGIAYPAHY